MFSRDVIFVGGLLSAATLVLGIVTGLIGISYPVRVDNTALVSPVKVERISGHQIELSDGRVITLGDDQEWKDRIAYSKNWVELEGPPEGETVWVYGDREFKLCGTPWAAPIRIPIIPDRIPRNERQLIAVGKMTEKEGQTLQREVSPSAGGR